MESRLVDLYVKKLGRELHRRGLSDPEILTEIQGHLIESVERGVRIGLSPAEAQQQALSRFGSTGIVAAQFAKQRKVVMQKALLSVAVILGLLILYVDSRPNWDDTGITVFALLLSAAVVGLFTQRRPWLYGVAIGVWIPAVRISRTHDFLMLVVLLIPLAGVYAGWGCRKALRKTYHRA